MAFHIKKPSIMNSQITVYYKGSNRWSDLYSERLVFDENPSSLLENPDGKNGGFRNAIVVSE
jgi:hypothetical protein